MNIGAITKDMMAAGKDSFGASWPDIKDVAEVEFKLILNRLKEIAKVVANPNNTVDLVSGKHLVKAQIDLAAQAVVGLTTMTIVAVQKALRAVLKVVKGTVNTALNIPLL